MVRSEAETVDQYLAELEDDRRELVEAVREVVLANLPEGYEEAMGWGMISYEIPLLSRYPETYNGRPLAYAALASQKNYVSLYLMGVYGDEATEQWFHSRYAESGKRLDMGKSCVRFKRLEDVPLDVIGEVIGRLSVDDMINRYESARKRS